MDQSSTPLRGIAGLRRPARTGHEDDLTVAGKPFSPDGLRAAIAAAAQARGPDHPAGQ